MDDSKKLLELCRKLADQLDDSLAAGSVWDIPALIEPLVKHIHKLTRACGHLHSPLEWYPDVGGRAQWQSWTFDGLDSRYDDAMPHLEWWKRARVMLGTWVRGLEAGGDNETELPADVEHRLIGAGIQPQPLRLVREMWGRDSTEIEEMRIHVWLKLTDDAVKGTLRKANAALLAAGEKRELRKRGGLIVWD